MTMERISESGIDLVKYGSTEGVTTKIIDKPILKHLSPQSSMKLAEAIFDLSDKPEKITVDGVYHRFGMIINTPSVDQK